MKLLRPTNYVFLFISVITLMPGCAQLSQISQNMDNYFAEQRLSTYNNCQDKTIVDKYYSISADGKQYGIDTDAKNKGYELEQITASSISLKKEFYHEMNMQMMSNTIENYDFDGSADLVAIKYVEAAKSRNNVVKYYKPTMGKMINAIFQQPYNLGKNRTAWLGLDNALIEYDKSGRIVSFLTRSHLAVTAIGVTSYQYSTIYFGSANIRNLENRINNSAFTENFIREL